MANDGTLRDYYDESLKCVRCGLCQAVCPVFAVDRGEAAVARGKVQIVRAILEERIAPSSPARERIFFCLNCDACTANCPSGVAVTDVILAARAQLRRDLGASALEQLVLRQVLAHPGRVELGAAAVALYQKSGLRWLAHKVGILRLLPGDLSRKDELLPAALDPTPARKRLAAGTVSGQAKYRVAYFVGCVTNVLYQSLARSVVAVLQRHDCQVVQVEGLRCCGMPHRNYGDTETAAALAEHNVRLLNATPVDAIVTDCATCGSTLRGYSGLQAPVYDINQFLAEHVGVVPPQQPLLVRVTYHDPCHLARRQGIREAPRRLLQAIPEVTFVEMAEADRCCGGAGTFALMHYDVSMQILDRKMDNAAATAAEILATGCPSCRMQLSHGVARQRRRQPEGRGPQEVLHPVELLARAYGI